MLSNPVGIGVPGFDDDGDCPGDTNGDGMVCSFGDDGVDEAVNLFTYPLVYTFIDGSPSALLEDTGIGIFAQDTWEIGPRTLIDYGLRYDITTYTLPDSATVDSTVPNGGASRDSNNIAPRLSSRAFRRVDGAPRRSRLRAVDALARPPPRSGAGPAR